MGKQNWITATSINIHLTSQVHLKAVDRRNGEKAVRERLAEEHRVESQRVSHDQQPTNLRRVKITEPTPSFGSKPPNQPPNAFWNLYDEDFMVERDMGEVQKETLEQEVRQGFDSWKLNMFQESRVQLDSSMMDDEAELELLAMIQGADVDKEEQVNPLSVKVDPATQWFPYESETMFLLDWLDNILRNRVSNSLMQNFLLVLKALRVKDVPSLKRLRAFQESLRKESGIPTMPCKSFQGNVFHMNDPRAIIAKDWTDPDIRHHLHVYPKIPEDGIISEVWHADKWRKEMDLCHLSPVPETDETARFRIYGNSGPSDNPMQSEICSHMGQNANYSCRKCKVGGSRKDKMSDRGFHELFSVGQPRSKEEVLLELQTQLRLACEGVNKPIKDQQTETGIKDPFTQYWVDDLLQRFKSMRAQNRAIPKEVIAAELRKWVEENDDDIITGFLTLSGFDPTKDTPVEFLLEIVNIFHLYDLVDDDMLRFWKVVGELSALVWVSEIRNLTEYISDIDIGVANVLDAFAQVDPSKIPAKSKFHLLTHLVEDIKRFGPLVGLSTEVFELFNSVFRACSILSNHLAPSRDIALQLADQEGLKQRMSRGWWYLPTLGKWVQ
ncbi:hypothetical protein PQX77_014561 [Marasmius sp. AFHP31]|nr:hypothetical protein PQX77_014561 [Marasmius sp. AFHP31]